MKTLIQTLLSIILAIALLGIGFYLGTQQAAISQLASQVGLGNLPPATANTSGASSTQTFRPQAGNAGNTAAGDSGAPAGGGFPANGAGLQISDDQTVAIRPVGAGGGTVQATGAVAASGSQPVALPMAGTIQTIAVAPGDTVAAGDLLLTLDAAGLEQAVQEALVVLDSAQRNLDTLNAAPAKNSADVTAAEQTLADALASLQAASANLTKAEVKAPISGIALSIDVVVGQEVQTGAQVAVLADPSSALEVTVNVAAGDASSISANQTVSVTVDSLPGQSFAGTVSAIAAITGSAVPVTIRLADSAIGHVQPGMLVNASFGTVQGAAAGWLVPATAVQERNGGAMLFVFRDGQPARVQVTMGETQGEDVVVDSPELQEGDRVVSDVAALFQGGGFQRNGAAPGNGQPRQQQP